MSNESPVTPNLDLAKAEEICKEHPGRKGDLLVVLQKIQTVYGYVPKSVLPVVSRYLGATSSEIFGVLTFYNRFHLSPRGKNTIRACRGTACHFKGAPEIIESMRKSLKMNPRQDTTEDALFSLEEVACLGACGIAPVITVNEDTYGSLTPGEAVEIIGRYATSENASEEKKTS
jgi:NADH-quinone oxidoreductase subunit E